MGPKTKPLGLTSLTSLVVANMIGAGVFTTSGFALADLGSPDRVMMAWVIGGIIALCGALSYGGLVRRITDSGGEYLFLSRIIHPLAGFIAGWVSLLAGFTGAIAFAALAFESYATPVRPGWLPPGGLAVALILFATLMHGVKVKVGALSQNTAVILKVGFIIVFLLLAGRVALTSGIAPPPPPERFQISSFAGTLVWISLSYSGFNAAVYVAGEAENGPINTPRALWIGTILVTVLYLALNAAFVYLPDYDTVANREDVAVAAAFSIGGESVVIAARFLIALALATSVFSMVMAGARVYARMADDGVFPQLFRFDREAPTASIALQGVLPIIVIVIADLKDLLSYLGFTLSISAALTVASLFVLRTRQGAEAVPVPGYPLTPAVFVITTLILAALAGQRNPAELAAALITILSGSAVFFIVKKLRGILG